MERTMLKIYGVPISVHTRKVIVAARLKSLPFEIVPVVPVIPDNPPANWRDLSPTGKVPALQDGDYTLADSAAICAYLERKQPTPSLYPSDDRLFGQALWLEQYAGGTVFRDVVHALFHQVFVHPKIRGIPTDQGRVDDVLTRAVPEVFGYLETVSNGTFLAGDAPSVADLAVASNLVNMQYIGFALERQRFPRLANLFDRVIRIPAMTEALRDEQPVVRQMGLKSEFLNAVLG
jgi:glutathione S-transferase